MTPTAILGLAEELGFPAAHNAVSGKFSIPAGEAAWRRAINPTTPEATLTEARFWLDEARKRQQRDADAEAKRAQRDAGPDLELIEEERREAAAELARHVAERPARIEQLLVRIANALDAPRRG